MERPDLANLALGSERESGVTLSRISRSKLLQTGIARALHPGYGVQSPPPC